MRGKVRKPEKNQNTVIQKTLPEGQLTGERQKGEREKGKRLKGRVTTGEGKRQQNEQETLNRGRKSTGSPAHRLLMNVGAYDAATRSVFGRWDWRSIWHKV